MTNEAKADQLSAAADRLGTSRGAAKRAAGYYAVGDESNGLAELQAAIRLAEEALATLTAVRDSR